MQGIFQSLSLRSHQPFPAAMKPQPIFFPLVSNMKACFKQRVFLSQPTFTVFPSTPYNNLKAVNAPPRRSLLLPTDSEHAPLETIPPKQATRKTWPKKKTPKKLIMPQGFEPVAGGSAVSGLSQLVAWRITFRQYTTVLLGPATTLIHAKGK